MGLVVMSDHFDIAQSWTSQERKDLVVTRVHEVLAVHNLADGLLGGPHGAVIGAGDFVSHYR